MSATYVIETYRVIHAVRRESYLGGWTEVTAENVNNPADKIECVRDASLIIGDTFTAPRTVSESEGVKDHKSDVFMLGPVDMTITPKWNSAAGPFRAAENKIDAAGQFYPVSASTSAFDIIALCLSQADAERIAYCLNIVAESEETDRKAGGK